MRLIHIVAVLIALSGAPLHAQNLVLNGELDESLVGWNTEGDPNMTAIWSAADSNASFQSGSMRITNISPGASNGVAVIQCVPVNSGQSYTYTAKVRVPSGAAQNITNQAVISLRWYSGPDCSIPNGGSITAGSSPQNFDQWVSQTGTATARTGSRSVEVRALLSKFPAGGSFIAHFDDMTLTSRSIFQNGFD